MTQEWSAAPVPHSRRLGIGGKLLAAFGAMAALTVVATAIAWILFANIRQNLAIIAEESLPEIAASFRLAEESAHIAASLPRLITVQSQSDLSAMKKALDVRLDAIAALTDIHGGHEGDAALLVDALREVARTLRSRVERLERAVQQSLSARQKRESLLDSLSGEHRVFMDEFDPIIEGFHGDLLAATTASRAGSTDAFDLEEGIGKLETLHFIHSDTNHLFGLLGEAGTAIHSRDIEALRLRFDLLRGQPLERLTVYEASKQDPAVRASVEAVLAYGEGDRSILSSRLAELEALENASVILDESEKLADRMNSSVKGLVDEAERAGSTAESGTRIALWRGERVLFGIAGLSLAAALLIAWLYVFRGIVRRLTGLSSSTLSLANGNLETEIAFDGDNDEIADMRKALVVFRDDAFKRRQAEQALRQAKDQAEEALSHLKAAQERLVQTEKMASLGQLTAGVAHEIKNPLNFVKNFSEVSSELLDELKEGLGTTIATLEKERRDDTLHQFATIEDVLAKIKEHGERADSIVKSMLSHTRESPSTTRPTDLNKLLEESLDLAYHAARAEDKNFNVTLNRTLDPDVGELELFPAELMRVFLNLIGNAFDATRQRQVEGGDSAYVPTVEVSTRGRDGAVEVRVQDSGTGVPESIKDKIFDPFFTTKAPGEGTGLGLSLSYETVVQQHNGWMEVSSEEGKFTEFIVTLPR
jgi:signal transduction histidine kinase